MVSNALLRAKQEATFVGSQKQPEKTGRGGAPQPAIRTKCMSPVAYLVLLKMIRFTECDSPIELRTLK
jgi:hypothetical protein